MLLGPVFRAELIRTSRQRRYYVLRVLYGLGLLLLVWSQYMSLTMRNYHRDPLAAQLTDFARTTFLMFAVVQVVTILALVPALFGGVIADEKQRKTIHYLMASRLDSAEIVGDKLAARLLHVGIFVLIGLPVVSLLGLFGGISWDSLLIAYVGTCTSTFFAASLATFVSTLARRVRQAVLIAYILELAWLFVPSIAGPVCRSTFPNTFQWFGPINEWVQLSSPFGLYEQVSRQVWMSRTPATSLLGPFLTMVGLQLAMGLSLLLLAVWTLRPIFRLQAEGGRRVTWFRAKARRPRWLARPACGDDAMLWKERHFARTDVFTKLVVLPATILLTVCVILASSADELVGRAFHDLIQGGYGSWSDSAEKLNEALRNVSPLYVGLWLLAVAGASASVVGVERDEDTWISLTATPLSGWEILRGKLVGAVWGLRGFGALIGLVWLLGLVLGAIHPLGLLLGLGVVGLLTWFVAALGTAFSLTSRTTTRALTKTLVTLIFLNGGYLLIAYPLTQILARPLYLYDSPVAMYFNDALDEFVIVGCTPIVAAESLLSYQDVRDLLKDPSRWIHKPQELQVFEFALLLLLSYALAALLVTRRTVARFDLLIDRPRRGDPRSTRLSRKAHAPSRS